MLCREPDGVTRREPAKHQIYIIRWYIFDATEGTLEPLENLPNLFVAKYSRTVGKHFNRFGAFIYTRRQGR